MVASWWCGKKVRTISFFDQAPGSSRDRLIINLLQIRSLRRNPGLLHRFVEWCRVLPFMIPGEVGHGRSINFANRCPSGFVSSLNKHATVIIRIANWWWGRNGRKLRGRHLEGTQEISQELKKRSKTFLVKLFTKKCPLQVFHRVY